MKLYARILSYLKPHALVLAVAVAATFLYALLDGTTFVLLIPFVQTLFTGASMAGAGGTNLMSRLLDATVYRWIDIGEIRSRRSRRSSS